MPNEDPNYIDLFDLNLNTEPSFNWRDGSMVEQEKLITEELRHRGYVIQGHWTDGERDSFGPLSRVLHIITPQDRPKIIVYG